MLQKNINFTAIASYIIDQTIYFCSDSFLMTHLRTGKKSKRNWLLFCRIEVADGLKEHITRRQRHAMVGLTNSIKYKQVSSKLAKQHNIIFYSWKLFPIFGPKVCYTGNI
jgi:hypothetical protein